jgi:hypothetical protein
MDSVTDHEQRLEWNHHLIVFHVVANQHENGFLGHVGPPGNQEEKHSKEMVNPTKQGRYMENGSSFLIL